MTVFLWEQVIDSGEQGLFGDLQTTVSTIAMTTTSASLVPPNESRHGHHQVSFLARSVSQIRADDTVALHSRLSETTFT